MLDELAYSKVANLDLSLGIEQDVIQLYISMQNLLRMAVSDSIHDLLENVLSNVLFQSPPLSDIVKQVSPST